MMSYSILKELQAAKGMLNVKQVATIFSASEKAIYKLANKPAPAGMPCIRVGASIKFDPLTLIYWLRQQDPRIALAAKAQAKEEGKAL